MGETDGSKRFFYFHLINGVFTFAVTNISPFLMKMDGTFVTYNIELVFLIWQELSGSCLCASLLNIPFIEDFQWNTFRTCLSLSSRCFHGLMNWTHLFQFISHMYNFHSFSAQYLFITYWKVSWEGLMDPERPVMLKFKSLNCICTSTVFQQNTSTFQETQNVLKQKWKKEFNLIQRQTKN